MKTFLYRLESKNATISIFIKIIGVLKIGKVLTVILMSTSAKNSNTLTLAAKMGLRVKIHQEDICKLQFFLKFLISQIYSDISCSELDENVFFFPMLDAIALQIFMEFTAQLGQMIVLVEVTRNCVVMGLVSIMLKMDMTASVTR